MGFSVVSEKLLFCFFVPAKHKVPRTPRHFEKMQVHRTSLSGGKATRIIPRYKNRAE